MRSTVTVQVKDQRPGYIQASLGLILMESKFPESHAQTLSFQSGQLWKVVLMRFKWVNIFTAVPVLKLGDTFSMGKTNVLAANAQAVLYPESN